MQPLVAPVTQAANSGQPSPSPPSDVGVHPFWGESRTKRAGCFPLMYAQEQALIGLSLPAPGIPTDVSKYFLKSLRYIPAHHWTDAEPQKGWNYRSQAFVAGEKVEVLFDTGAVTSAVSEETVLSLFNRAVSKNLQPTHPQWHSSSGSAGGRRK